MPAVAVIDSLPDCSESLGCIVHHHNPLAGPDEKLPDYCESAEVIPITPSQNDRYERQALVSPEYMTIKRGLYSSVALPEPPYFAKGWIPQINPEGSAYRINAERHIVADVPMERSETVLHWADHLHIQTKALGIALPEEYEMYLNPDSEGKTCKYYFVDHQNLTVFWLNDIDPYRHDIDLPPACSITHMKFLLQEQYWKHVEYFPHRAVPQKLKNELISIFTQARADLLTSVMSTFPYSAIECEQFLQILKSNIEDNEYSTWITARLWATISRHRYHTFYGEDYARLSRDQRRYDKAATQQSTLLEACCVLLFNMPKRRADEMVLLFVDEIAFSKHWREYAASVLKEWRETCAMAIGSAIVGATSALRPTNPASAAFGTVSVAFALYAAAAGALLLQRYADAEKFSASTTADHLSKIEHPQLGFHPIATVYALPRGLAFWSLIFLAGHLLTAFVDLKGVFVVTPAIAFSLVFILYLFKANAILRIGFNAENAAEKEEAAQ